ncbi:lipocalin family protein [Vibrio methylphosphonaticus]|uniref:lipocalin family protein n=1 Tax=Vibrio methylphosphonaticus TaxID=2946866 RepID=UPI00202A1B08|nr:lipocalin family protein [Vibrio methylphosphonaticus]MCL9774922.1 lipocalin family protein [Vibrio methylphosphonaticus]
MNLNFRKLIVLGSIALLAACTGMPSNVQPVSQFELNRYLGQWYEVARLDHSFERGLDNVSAFYSINEDGSVKVVNRGWDSEENEWSEAEGKAKFIDTPDIGHLKVSFFGPFYGSYVVYYLEDDYSVALVSGYNLDYFWLLSRSPTLPQEALDNYIQIADKAGFDTNSLIFPNQDKAQVKTKKND